MPEIDDETVSRKQAAHRAALQVGVRPEQHLRGSGVKTAVDRDMLRRGCSRRSSCERVDHDRGEKDFAAHSHAGGFPLTRLLDYADIIERVQG